LNQKCSTMAVGHFFEKYIVRKIKGKIEGKTNEEAD
jgi:hypothetical protein